MSDERLSFRYGPSPSQYMEAWLPDGGPPPPVAIVIHGGWWRARHDLHLMDGLCADLARRGWLAVNIEFRRIDGDGGGWPVTLEDVCLGIRSLPRSSLPPAPTPPVAIGHSAGGHLALLAATSESLGGVVGLAPVTDVARCARSGLGEGAAAAFVGTAPGEDPARFDAASPVRRVPLGCPQLIVHGDQDARVPVQHSRDYVAASRAAGDQVEYAEVEGGDHFCVIDPSSAPWSRVRTWLDEHDGR
jgi:acetyl esterase/lipase